MKRTILLILSLFLIFTTSFTQIDDLDFTETASLEFPVVLLQFKSGFHPNFDENDAGYLYSANMSSGLGIYDISTEGEINTVADLDISYFNGLDVSNVEQEGDYLYLPIGDFQDESNPASGLAIVNVSNPASPIVESVWDSTAFVFGTAAVHIEGDYAYLGAMNDGLVILNIANKSNPFVVSHLPLDVNFPEASLGEHHQARGITYKDGLVYVTFDRGGLRVVNVEDKVNPVEVYKYSNPELPFHVLAYNDIQIKDHYAFVSLDFCGLEVLDISSYPFTLIQFFNPLDCATANWFGAAQHNSELVKAANDSLLLVAAGNSELLAFDISDPANTQSLDGWIDLDDEKAAWGIDVRGDDIVLSFINNPLNIPYVGNWGGLKILHMEKHYLVNNENLYFSRSINIHPNPVNDLLFLEHNSYIKGLKIYAMNGKLIRSTHLISSDNSIDVSMLAAGIYFIEIETTEGFQQQKFIKI